MGEAGPRTQGSGKAPDAFRTIREVSEELGEPQHVLRFWETKFHQLRPLKRGGNRRLYRPEDVALLRRIRGLIRTDGYSIRGVQKLLRENGAVRTDGAAPASGLDPKVRAEAERILEELESLGAMLRSGRID